MTVTIPYYKDALHLPGPLPTVEEIEAASEVLPTNHYESRIVIVREKYVVKYGPFVSENEGFAMLFLEDKLSIPAPTLYAMFRHEAKLYLVMENIRGTELSKLWPSLSNAEKLSISHQLRQTMDEMRSLEAPTQQFSNVTGGAMPHRYFWSPDNNLSVTGPFESERDLNFALAERSRLIWQDKGSHGWISDFLHRNLALALQDHRPTFTHADFHASNILVVGGSTEYGEDKDDWKVSGIVDWETSGWYPSYWEYAAAFVNFTWVNDWPEKFESIVTPWPLEAAMLRIVRQDLEF